MAIRGGAEVETISTEEGVSDTAEVRHFIINIIIHCIVIVVLLYWYHCILVSLCIIIVYYHMMVLSLYSYQSLYYY